MTIFLLKVSKYRLVKFLLENLVIKKLNSATSQNFSHIFSHRQIMLVATVLWCRNWLVLVTIRVKNTIT